MADRPFSDLEEFLKTDVLKDWMHRDFRNMTSSSSSDYSLPSPSATSADNNIQQKSVEQQQRRNYRHQQFESSLSSLESFLFLPQLPVDGDDGDENAWLFPHHHYQRQLNPQQKVLPEQQQQQRQQRSFSSSLLAIVNPTTKSSSGIRTYKNSNNNPASFSGHQNDDHETSCNKQCYTDAACVIPTITRRCDDDFEQKRCSCSISSSRNSSGGSHVCGSSKPTDSLFPFIAANDTVIAASSSNNSNNDDDDAAADVVVNNKSQQQKLSSSMSILIKNTNPGNNNSHHNHSTSPPFYLAANHYHRQGKHSHHPHQQPHSHYRPFIRRRLLIFRICQALSVLLCVLFLFNLVKNSIWTNDPYNNRVEAVSSSLTSTSSSRLQNRLIQSWNMPSLVAPSSSLSSPASSATFKIPEILSVASANNHNDDREEVDDDSNMYNLMLLDVPNFRFLMNNKTKCNIPRDDDNYSDGVGRGGSDVDGTTASNHGKGTRNSASMIFFMIIVHSAPRNFEERQAIRETWGSLQRLGQFHIRLVFLLGHELNPDDDDDHDHDHKSNKNNNNISNNNVVADEKGDRMNSGSGKPRRYSFHEKIQRESQQHGDIVTGNFHDSYRNLTYKHLMGYLWVLNHCSHAKYVLKADDDAFIDIFQLFEFLLRTFGKDPEPALICNVFPENTKPVRRSDVLGTKWAVTYEEYPYETYPKYCGGLAYLATPNILREIYRMSRSVKNKFLWIDDVYVTGILREMAHVEPFYLNLRYSYDPEEYRKWLATSVKKSYVEEKVSDKDSVRIGEDTADNEINGDRRVGVATQDKPALSNQMNNEDRKSPPKKIPFMIVHMERGSQLGREMRELWNKTVSVWSGSSLIN